MSIVSVTRHSPCFLSVPLPFDQASDHCKGGPARSEPGAWQSQGCPVGRARCKLVAGSPTDTPRTHPFDTRAPSAPQSAAFQRSRQLASTDGKPQATLAEPSRMLQLEQAWAVGADNLTTSCTIKVMRGQGWNAVLTEDPHRPKNDHAGDHRRVDRHVPHRAANSRDARPTARINSRDQTPLVWCFRGGYRGFCRSCEAQQRPNLAAGQ